MKAQKVISELLDPEVPSIRYKIRVNVLGEDSDSSLIQALQSQIRESELARTLLQGQDASGRISTHKSVYAKWQGAHWVMVALADIGYPAEDTSLARIRDQLQEQ